MPKMSLLIASLLSLSVFVGAQCGGNGGNGHLSSSPMALGTTVNLMMSGAAGQPCMLFVAAGPGPVQVAGFGTICLDVNSMQQLVSAAIPGGGTLTLPVAVPNDLALLSLIAFLQGIVADPAAPLGFALTEALRVQFGAPDSYNATPSMSSARAGGAGAALLDGRVLLTGGGGGTLTSPSGNASTEFFDAVNRNFVAGPTMAAARGMHTATRLNDGRVLIVGGVSTGSVTLASCEIFDPATGAITPTGSLAGPRAGHNAVLLGNGRVLVAGGTSNFIIPVGGTIGAVLNASLTTGEVYNPATNLWSPAGNAMASKRFGCAGVRLNDGRALITSGISGTTVFFGLETINFTATTSYFDPATNLFSAGPSIGTGRALHSAATLPDGRVYVAGGALAALIPAVSNTTRVLSGGVFGAGPTLALACAMPTLVLQGNGALHIAGGISGDLVTQTFGAVAAVARYLGTVATPLSALPMAMGGQFGFRLLDGSLLYCGGSDAAGTATLASFIYTPSP